MIMNFKIKGWNLSFLWWEKEQNPLQNISCRNVFLTIYQIDHILIVVHSVFIYILENLCKLLVHDVNIILHWSDSELPSQPWPCVGYSQGQVSDPWLGDSGCMRNTGPDLSLLLCHQGQASSSTLKPSLFNVACFRFRNSGSDENMPLFEKNIMHYNLERDMGFFKSHKKWLHLLVRVW